MDIKARIAALLAMTKTAGCTEAEAMAAAKKAAALMLEHCLSAADIEMSEATVNRRTRGKSVRDFVVPVIARCTNTSAIVIRPDDTHGAQVEFIGRAPGPEIAVYLCTICERAINSAVAEFKRTSEYRQRRSRSTRRISVQDFTLSMVARLSKRLTETFKPLISAKEQGFAHKALARRYRDTERTSMSKKRHARFSGAFSQGASAADNVTLTHGVDEDRPGFELENIR